MLSNRATSRRAWRRRRHPGDSPRTWDPHSFAAEDQRLRKKAEARRQLEDLIFDIMDGESTARQRAAAEEAETWLEENRDTFDRVTLQELQRRKTELQRMQQADDDRRRRD